MRRRALLPALLLAPGLAAAKVPGATAPPLLPPPPLPNVPLARGITAPQPGVWRVEFPPQGEVLEAPQRLVLSRIGAVLNSGTEGRITLIAEVAEAGDLSATRRLSLARARAVKAALAVGGLAETRIDIRAMGHTGSGRDSVDVLAPFIPKP